MTSDKTLSLTWRISFVFAAFIAIASIVNWLDEGRYAFDLIGRISILYYLFTFFEVKKPIQ